MQSCSRKLSGVSGVSGVSDVAGLAWALGAGLLASALAWLLMWRWFARRLQGFTGDCLGATQQVCELAFYLGVCLAVGQLRDIHCPDWTLD
jgi:adenosylcobinamide-GDP ribazoletransferase